MSWLNYKDCMLNFLSLGDVFPPIVMLLWQRGSMHQKRTSVGGYNAKGLIFCQRKVKKADQLKRGVQ